MGFAFFLLLNLTLFVRPMEILPELEGVRLYEICILMSLVLSAPEILHFFSTRSLGDQPVTLCVLGLFGSTLLAQAGNPSELLRHAEHFGKIFLYYVLAVGVLNSAARLRIFLVWLLVCFLLLTSLTLLQYHEILHLPRVDTRLLDPELDSETGELKQTFRLQGTGIFQDPNEFCGILAVAVPLCLWALSGPARGLKPLWLALLLQVMYGIYLTKSRGGLLGLLAGMAVLSHARYGLKRTLLFGALAAPVVLVLFAGRQTELSTSSGTAQSRLQLWSDWLGTFRQNPVFGNGLNLASAEDLQLQKSVHDTGHLAHNSYLQAFADWGFPGGTLFLGAFCLAIWAVGRFRSTRTFILDPDLRRMQPFLLGVLASYAAGIFSLSMSDRVPTYLMLSLGCVFPLLARSVPPVAPPRLTGRVFLALVGLAIGFLIFLYVFVRLFVNW